jgi:hypothetical protein
VADPLAAGVIAAAPAPEASAGSTASSSSPEVHQTAPAMRAAPITTAAGVRKYVQSGGFLR